MDLLTRFQHDVNRRANEKLAEHFETPEQVKDFIDRTSKLTGVKSDDLDIKEPSPEIIGNAGVAPVRPNMLTGKYDNPKAKPALYI